MSLRCTVHTKEPLLLLVHSESELTLTDVEEFTTFFNKHLHGKKQFNVLFDLRKLKSAPKEVMIKMGSYISNFEILAVGKVLASSVIINSKTIETLLNILFKINPPTTPTKVTSDLKVGCSFLDEY